MQKIVECVPNFSEGKEKSIIDAISASIKSVDGVKLINTDPGADFNRTVYTFVGEPENVLEAAFQCARVGTLLIDMSKHHGEHARMGALDVMPFIPIKNITTKDCIKLSKEFGRRMSKELGIPVFLYANSATKPERVKLPDIRQGEYESLEEKFKNPSYKPDFGEPIFIPKSGATATGARDILIAYNINLDTNDKKTASKIAGKIRTSGIIKKDENGEKIIGINGKPERIPGRFKGVQAGGMMYNENIAQISMNLLNFKDVNIHDVFEASLEEAEKLGVKVTGSEIVGLLPKDSLLNAGRYYSQKNNIKCLDEDEYVDLAIEKLGLSQLYPFIPEEKVIEYMVQEAGPLVSKKVDSFLTDLASDSPAPGGGSVAALSGALGASLTSMVCNLTIGKDKYSEVQNEIKKTLNQTKKLRKKLTKLIDEDTEAFNKVMKAFKMPKDGDEQKKKRSKAIQEGYKTAANVPLETANICIQGLNFAKIVAEKGNKNSITDAAVSALMLKAGFESAVLNVKINLGSIKDEKYVSNISNQIQEMEKYSKEKTKEILVLVDELL